MKCPTNETSHGDPGLLGDFVRGKTVWDIGAGDGRFAQSLRDLGAEVTCVEIDEVLAFQCKGKGLNTLPVDFELLTPDCDIIYAFLSFVGNYKLTRWLKKRNWHGTVISQYYPLGEESWNLLNPDEIIHSDLPFLIYHI